MARRYKFKNKQRSKKRTWSGVSLETIQWFQKRNEKMVLCLQTNTLKETGKKFGITRERVRQIYRKMTGKPYTELKNEKNSYKQRKREEEKKRKESIVQFYCKECKKPVFEKRDIALRSQLCKPCRLPLRQHYRSYTKSNICQYCHKTFRPYRNTPNQPFCSSACYTAFGRGRKNYRQVVVKNTFRINGKIIKSI